MKDFTEYLNEAVRSEELRFGGHRLAFPLLMNDGTQMSIQASSTHYCEPRETTEVANYNWYEEFEIGYPTKEIELLLPYAEDEDNPADTVYAYVPKSVIRLVIESCGGVKEVVRG